MEYKEKFEEKPSHGWKTSLEAHVTYDILDSQQFRACIAISSTDLWFKETQIEIGGDESSAHVARGKEFLQTAARGAAP